VRTIITGILIGSAMLSGCATPSEHTWVCKDGECTARGIMVSSLDDNATLIATNPNLLRPAQKIKYLDAPSTKWAPEITTGVKKINDVQAKLIHMVNALNDAVGNGTGDELLGKIFVGLISYMSMHFADEERLLFGSELANQKQENEIIMNKLLDMKQALKSGKSNVSQQTLAFMKEWIASEIRVEGEAFVKR